MLRSALRFAAGVALAALVWSGIAPGYVELIAPMAQRLVSADPRLRHLDVKPQDGKMILRGGTDAPELPLGWLAADQLTYNVILLAGLFATSLNVRRARSWGAMIVAFLLLVLTHVLALATGIEQVYATTAGAWSDAHYGGNEQDFWKAALYAYQLAGMFAVSFALWWLSGSSEGRRARA